MTSLALTAGSGDVPGPATAGGLRIVCKPGGAAGPIEAADTEADRAGFLPRVDDLLPSAGERFASALRLQLELTDVEDFFFEERTVSRGEDQPERTVFVLHENPEDSLWKASVTLELSRLFQTPQELAAAYGLVAGHEGLFDTGHDPLAGTTDKVGHFTASGRSWMVHLLSGFTVSFAMSERQPLNGNQLIDERFLSDDESKETFAVRFDVRYRRPAAA